MPRYVSHRVVSTINHRVIKRLRYLEEVKPRLRSAFERRHREDPQAEDYSLVGLQVVSAEGVAKLAAKQGRTPETVRQDLGMLVAIVLVELFGLDRVQTLRGDDGRTVATRRVPQAEWPELVGVKKFSVHRVAAEDGVGEERIILDTNMAMDYALGHANKMDFERLLKSKGSRLVSVADGAVAELSYWLLTGSGKREPFPGWTVAASVLDRVLDPDMPIAPGGHERAAFSGLTPFKAGFDEANFRAYSKAGWEQLSKATSARDLGRETRFTGPDGRQYKLEVRSPKAPLNTAAHAWAGVLSRMGSLLADIPKEKRPSLEDLVELMRGNVAGSLNLPEGFTEKLDLPIRAMASWAFHAMNQKPDPEKSNHPLDFDLLFYAAMPAIVCTSDERLVRLVRQLRCPDAVRVVTPIELFSLLESGESPSGDVKGRAEREKAAK